MKPVSQRAVEIWNAAVDRVKSRPLVSNAIGVDEQFILIGDQRWPRENFDRVVAVGGGKAAVGMALGLHDAFAGAIPLEGWVNAPADTVPTENPTDIVFHPARPGGINEPTEAGVAGTKRILALMEQCGERDFCVALISGGGSALLPAPLAGVTLADKVAVTRHLSAAGANIDQLNTVRKQLSQIKGGGLLRACRSAELVSLILSDVLGDPLDVIASGPTVSNTTSATDALEILSQFDQHRSLPESVYQTLQSRQHRDLPSSCKSTVLVLGNNTVAVQSSADLAVGQGMTVVSRSATESEGDAELLGQELADELVLSLRDERLAKPLCVISGGEPTVTLTPDDIRGKGGRNQQLVLAAYLRLVEHELTPQEWRRIALLSGGTDGEDGPTDAAGAWIDADVHGEIQRQALDGRDYLSRNDAYSLFKLAGGLLQTGPSGTNVCDVRVAVVL